MSQKKVCKHKPFFNQSINSWKCSLCSKLLNDKEANDSFTSKPSKHLSGKESPKIVALTKLMADKKGIQAGRETINKTTGLGYTGENSESYDIDI